MHRQFVQAAVLLCFHGPALAAWPVVGTVYDSSDETQALCVSADNGNHWLVGETVNGMATNSRTYVRRHDGSTLSSPADLWAAPSSSDRLTSSAVSLPACAIGDGTRLEVSMKRDDSGFTNPTVENIVVHRTALTLADNPPELIDEDSLLTDIRKQSTIAIDNGLTDVFACWTIDDGNDDVRCRGRDTSSTAWSDGYVTFNDPTNKEEHPSVAIGGTTVPERVVAYHDATVGVIVRVFDNSNPMVEATPNDVDIGGVGALNVNWPHIIARDGVLHLVAWNTGVDELIYGTCAADCHENANWTTEIIDDVTPNVGDAAKHPQIAVDSDNRVFVAFNYDSATVGSSDERVMVTARCSPGDWSDTPEFVDNSGGREQLGGEGVAKGHPSFVYDESNDKLSVVFLYATTTVPVEFIGRWARKGTNATFTDLGC